MLPYNPEEAVNTRTTVEAGIYTFFVEKAEGKEWNGNETTNLTLKVDLGDREVTAYETIYYTSKALFRIAQFSDCCGIDKPTEHEHYEGAAGRANFIVDEKGYLKVKWWEAKQAGDEIKTHQKPAAPQNADEIPF